ncbi:MAG: HD domain-containing protein, partial [Magnetococcales bacterium]|nr:HD domain-containing protein [Magnetococcales bacterium]NGZ29316.1 HD domain-containing protein [Magnetococcales bacterium]
FPFTSGAKLLLGFVTFGFFAALDVALARERRVANHLAQAGQQLIPDQNYFPLSARLAIFASLCLFYTGAILFLVILKDMDWLIGEGAAMERGQASLSILKEVAFVSLVMAAQIVNLIFAYSRNLGMFFHNENSVLMEASQGRLQRQVVIASNDEFGVMAFHTNQMIQSLAQHLQTIQTTQDVTIHALASLAETRDNETGAHILRTQRYVLVLARHLRHHPRYAHYLDAATIDLLYKSAPLHDVGKVGIPDHILLKPGKHTDEEFAIMKTHAQLGEEALRRAEVQLGPTSFLRFAREIAGGHHEKWDGSGYPRALAGEEIPLSARLMAVADVYDALISKRVYKPAFPHEKAKAIILEGNGRYFDPAVVEAFLAVEEEIQEIARQYHE